MQQLIRDNITWLYGYFERNKGLFEIFSFLMVAQSFMYSSDLKDIAASSVSAFKIVLWLLIIFVILLMQISTVVELQRNGNRVFGAFFKGANLMKTIMRLLTLVLLLACMPIFVKQIQTSLHNSLFSVFYVSLALLVGVEMLVYGASLILHRSVAGH